MAQLLIAFGADKVVSGLAMVVSTMLLCVMYYTRFSGEKAKKNSWIMNHLQRYKLSKIFSGFRIPFLYPALNHSECVEFERKMVESARQGVYLTLVDQGLLISEIYVEDRGRVMAMLMFERCGPCARALEVELTKSIGFKSFMFKNVGGHYVVQSMVTGLFYDVVTTKGVSCKENLDFVKYQKDKASGEKTPQELANKYAITF